jgi:hypothetical protein
VPIAGHALGGPIGCVSAGRKTRCRLSSDRSTQQQIAEWYNVNDLSIAFTFGTAPRTLPDVREPGKRNVDFSLCKSFAVTENLRAIFRAEAFNMLNTPQFGYANAQIGNSALGTISSTSVDSREIQWALKLQFLIQKLLLQTKPRPRNNSMPICADKV